MNEHNEENPPLTEDTAKKSDQYPQGKDSEKSNSSSSWEELIKNVTGSDFGTNLNQAMQGLFVVNNFIRDERSGGNYFADETKIDGDVIGRSQKKGTTVVDQSYSYVKEVAGKVLKDLEKIRCVYVKTNSYNEAKNVLKNKNILILWGNKNFGKNTTAIHLISELQVREILEIDPTIEKFNDFNCEEKQGYVIDTLAAESAGKLNNYVLNRLSEKLRDKDSYLIITIDSRVQLYQQTLVEYVLTWSERPTHNELLKSHLQWYLKDPSMLESSYTLAQSKPVLELLSNNSLPADIDFLAKLLSKSLIEKLPLEEVLTDFTDQINKKVASWFEEHQELSQYTFMIALAVLSGSNYQVVIEASKRLEAIIEQPLNTEEVSNSQSVLNTRRSERLKEVYAHLVQGYENTEFGRSPVELIELNNPKFQSAVLSHVWKEYDQLREPLLIWLHELGSHSDFQVRNRAAASVGKLSTYAFSFVREKVLLPWANCQDKRLQRLAAPALSIPIFESDLAPQVLGLLHHWSTVNNPNLRWTAATAYGGYVGLRFPDIAMRDLLAIAQSKEQELFLAVAESVNILFDCGKFLPNQYLTVLISLKFWTNQGEKTISHQLGLLIFSLLMGESTIPTDSSHGELPTLLWLANENQVYEDIVNVLLRRGLNLKLTRLAVLKQIENWLKIVDSDRHPMYRTIGRIIFSLVQQGTEREKERILTYINRWASSGNSNTASKILFVIKKHLSV